MLNNLTAIYSNFSYSYTFSEHFLFASMFSEQRKFISVYRRCGAPHWMTSSKTTPTTPTSTQLILFCYPLYRKTGGRIRSVRIAEMRFYSVLIGSSVNKQVVTVWVLSNRPCIAAPWTWTKYNGPKATLAAFGSVYVMNRQLKSCWCRYWKRKICHHELLAL